MTVLKLSKLQGFVWKTCKRDWAAKVAFWHTNASNFQQPLQSLLLRCTAENSQVA